jgi:5-methylcytosine-specific restriction endonuclease McrA
MPLTHRKRILKIAQAQGWICAGCGQPTRKMKRGDRNHADALTFDHIVPRRDGGFCSFENGVVKHRSCNLQRGCRPPTGCDRVWQAVVYAGLGLPS